LKPGRRGGKPATNRFSYGAANPEALLFEQLGFSLAKYFATKFPDGSGNRIFLT
jgi:hypothetical protein